MADVNVEADSPPGPSEATFHHVVEDVWLCSFQQRWKCGGTWLQTGGGLTECGRIAR